MLVLTRKSDEKIRIGNEIVITVLRTKGKAVRLGIEAPDEMRVLRGEIAFDGDHDRPAEKTGEEAKSRAVHARVPRDQVASILPHLAGSGPLAGFVKSSAVAAQ